MFEREANPLRFGYKSHIASDQVFREPDPPAPLTRQDAAVPLAFKVGQARLKVLEWQHGTANIPHHAFV